MAVLTYRFRLKDRHAAALEAKSRAANLVWNYCNETQRHAVAWGRNWLSGYDLGRLTAGTSVELSLLAESIEAVCHQYARSCRQHRRPWLRFRGKKSLGWVPFRSDNVRLADHGFIYHGQHYEPMHWRSFPEGARILAGSFSQDARGRWYINCPVEIREGATAKPRSAIGIDLGLKSVATLSTGEKVRNPKHFYAAADRYGRAQRANKKRLRKTLASKIANSRRDHLHKASARIALAHDLIFVGDVSSSKLAQTSMAKSVLDAGWHIFKSQLSYKAIRHGGRCIEVGEAWTSRTCSSCGAVPDSSPKGIGALGIREWACDCGAVHDRDVNAAKNILRLGLQSLVEGAARMRSSQSHRDAKHPRSTP